MRVKIVLCSVVIAIAALALTACDADWLHSFNLESYRYRFEDRYAADLEGAKLVSITIVNGPIRVTTWDSERVEIEVHERIRASSESRAEELAEEVRLDGRRLGSELRIELDYGGMRHRRRDYACELDVKLPTNVMLRLRTTNGSIEVEEMERKIEAGTTNGNISIAGCSDGADLSTTNGNINAGSVGGDLVAGTTNGSLTLWGVGGDVEASTTNGNITLSGAGDSGFELFASTTNGRVSESLEPGSFEGEYDRRRTHLEGKYRDGRHRVSLHTTNGSITIKD